MLAATIILILMGLALVVIGYLLGVRYMTILLNLPWAGYDELAVNDYLRQFWTKEKHAWLELPAHVLLFEEGYDRNKAWPQESLERLSIELRRLPKAPQ